ncbi:high-affinity iron permease [Mucor velutinosus]|uniref:High-affinity iron permease n=1 Tax=Mucor velutinosus TaxID=708070 RepID=A0AAN7HYD5_9FUNG|nr:high-affinity iron permease [Mucor velutinosus]
MTDLEIKGGIRNDQHLDLSTLLNARASSFLHHTKKRYRKLFPDAKPVNEKFIFPTQSQLKGLMEASKGICSWSGLQGQWRPEKSSHLFLLTIDHVVPVSKHGSPTIDNLQVVISMYNSVKSDEFESEFQRWLYYS